MTALTEQPRLGWGALRSKVVTWHDPAPLAAAGKELSGRQFLQGIIDGRLPPPPMARLTGARLLSVGDGQATFGLTPDESSYNPIGMVHGGLLCTMLDSAAGCAVHTLLPAGVGYSSIEIKVSFLEPVRAGGGEIDFHGQALRIGTRVAFAEAYARETGGKLVGHATSSIALLRP